jgi:hypothetical protein
MVPPAVTHFYAVTAAHVLTAGSNIRINDRFGKSRMLKIGPEKWTALYGIEDIVAIDITDRLDLRRREYSYVPHEMLATRDFVSRVELGVGEDGFMLGLFASHPGKNKNMFAARFGNLSMLADDNEPISQGNGITSPCHVFDMHSRPGFSGSPIFIYRTPESDLRDIRGRIKREHERLNQQTLAFANDPMWAAMWERSNSWLLEMDRQHNIFLVLLGIHVGQFHEKITARKDPASRAGAEADNTFRDGDKIFIAGSMTTVVPAWQIEKLLLEPDLLEKRRLRKDAISK